MGVDHFQPQHFPKPLIAFGSRAARGSNVNLVTFADGSARKLKAFRAVPLEVKAE